jgi:hypothetical protein
MGSLEIINRDKKGEIKQDLKVERTIKSGKTVEINKLKEKEKKLKNDER